MRRRINILLLGLLSLIGCDMFLLLNDLASNQVILGIFIFSQLFGLLVSWILQHEFDSKDTMAYLAFPMLFLIFIVVFARPNIHFGILTLTFVYLGLRNPGSILQKRYLYPFINLAVIILAFFLVPRIELRAQKVSLEYNEPSNIEVVFQNSESKSFNKAIAKPTVIVTWTQSCRACKELLMEVTEPISEEYDESVLFVALNVQQNADSSIFNSSQYTKHEIWYSPSFMSLMNLSGVPSLIILNSKAEMVYHNKGYPVGSANLLKAEIRNELKKLKANNSL
ncbi:MAG: hypothetical protein ACI8ZN_002124 [Bacteroidia bacterium]|jgi:hypothetical protein